jgi:FKBP-type peptidyl-prolyl cis-trans isomerase FklB
MRNKRCPKMSMRILLVLMFAGPMVLSAGDSQAAEKQKGSQEKATPTAAITEIRLSFKLDPRMVDGFRGTLPWVPGSTYTGVYAQDTVEAQAQGLDALEKAVKISPEWISSDAEMVTVTPSQGDDVKIKVLKAGESTLKITYQGLSTELIVKAKYVNKFISFEITQPTAAKKGERTAPAATSPPPAAKTKNDVSYAAGMNLAKALQEQLVDVDADLLLQGVKDTLSGGKTLMTEEQAAVALEGLQTDQRLVQVNVTRQALAEKNKREGEAFLAENKKKEQVVSLPSGLQYKIIKAGEGKRPTSNDLVVCGYRATFINGTEFGNSYKQSASVTFPVKGVIKGWQEALQLMPVGSKWQLFIPPELGYGERGAGGGGGRKAGPSRQIIGPNATLIFELELLAVQEPGAKPPASSSTAEKNLTPEQIEALKKVIEAQTKAEKKPGTNP